MRPTERMNRIELAVIFEKCVNRSRAINMIKYFMFGSRCDRVQYRRKRKLNLDVVPRKEQSEVAELRGEPSWHEQRVCEITRHTTREPG